MLERGIDISNESPQALTTAMGLDSDVIITMGCGDACPVYPGKRYLDWALSDPANKSLNEVRAIRDEIEQRVSTILSDLLGTQ